MVAEKATIEYFSLDKIMNSIAKTHVAMVDSIMNGGGNMELGKLLMSQYTFEDLGGKMKAQVNDGRKHGMFEVMNLEDDTWCEFIGFQHNTYKFMSWEQSAALYYSQKIPDCYIVSTSPQVLDYAQGLGISVISIEEMGQLLFADEQPEVSPDCPPLSHLVAPFDPRIDVEKVEAAFSDRLDGDLAVLKQKSYWVVVCVIFEWAGWLRLRKRADFCKWVNAHFHFEKPIDAETDLKSATNKIKVKERNLAKWPDNQYRDLAYLLKDMFFGKRQGLQNGFYCYANEPLYLKPGSMWMRKD